MRYKIDVAYKGTKYHGWQIQPNAITVQGELDKALSTFLRTPIETLGSGRTDAGVHARQQIVQFDVETPVDEFRFMRGINALLPHGILVKSIEQTHDEFHARFHATARAYRYYISKYKDPFGENQCYVFPKELDIEKMNEAAKCLFDHIDFESFSKIHTDVHTFNCTIMAAEWTQTPEGYVFYIKANRFLRGMVRAIVGTLLKVGLGKMNKEQFNTVILAKNRHEAGAAAPADGLFLEEVSYPNEEK
ncbi:MAG: tRNA pseudouridine(38-40) synthase TruA [Cytophagales bacterium]|nr:tRNA pseudouridine(38-40) synthase TruA [Cytophagales bacterium]